MAKIVESLKLDRLYPNYSSRPKSVGKISVYTVFWASFDPLLLVYVLCTQPLWRYEGLQLSICTNHTAGNTLNLQQERDIQIFSTQSGSQATCKLLDTCKYYLYKPDTCKPLTTTTLFLTHFCETISYESVTAPIFSLISIVESFEAAVFSFLVQAL